MASWQPSHHSANTGSPWRVRWRRRSVFRTIIVVVVLIILYHWSSEDNIPTFRNVTSSTTTNIPFKAIGTIGFRHPTNALPKTCSDLRLESRIAVDRSIHTEDDILGFATSVRDHPMVAYGGSSPAESIVVKDHWTRTGQSIIWLDQYAVYLGVTRVYFHEKKDPESPIMSFLRGQVYNAEWKELTDYTIDWNGTKIKFPKTFDVGAPYAQGEGLLGPQDPKIIIDDAVGAEPVIIFNMLANPEKQRRRREMYMHRPFSMTTTMFSVEGRDQAEETVYEKDWMPVFYREDDTKEPADHLHFVYNLQPLEVISCDLTDGVCKFVLRQAAPERFEDKDKVLMPGTNLVHAALHEHGIHIFIGFAGTHLRDHCPLGFYRPQLIVLAVTEDGQFHIEYLSNSLDFGKTQLQYGSAENKCGSGRKLTVNSISRWQRFQDVDIMTITFSLDDKSTQILRVKEVNRLVEDLLHGHTSMQHKLTGTSLNDPPAGFNNKVASCAIEAAKQYADRQIWRLDNKEFDHQRG